MLEVTAEWENLDEAFAELEAECTAVTRGLTVYLWRGILSRTPQFDGRMVASWSYSLGQPNYADRSSEATIRKEAGPTQPFRRGDRPSIDIANRYSSGADLPFRLGDQVFIANGVDHGEGPYSVKVEEGGVRLRPMNLPGAPVRRTLDSVSTNFGLDVSQAYAASLKQLKIGQHSANVDS